MTRPLRGSSSALLLVRSSALLSCANVQAPPGGPPDAAAPELVTTVPESLAVLPGFDGEVEFRFSEVVSEGSQPNQGLGTGDLERMVILSPSNRVPEVSWRRRRITVRPADGWQPDRVYRVELLPGIKDVRGNQAKVRRVVTFTTGAAVPADSLAGSVIDWKAGRPTPGALVEAVLLPDSLVYRGIADSSGDFRLGPLPRGTYLVYGVLDANRNLRREPREAFDSSRVAADSARVGDLYAFVHDTLPPRIQSVTPGDSVSATITFAAPLDPAQRLDSTAVTLRQLPDSAVVAVQGLRVPPAGERTDTAKAGRRPALSDRLLLEVVKPWKPGDRFLLEIRGVRTVSGTAGDVSGPLVIPQVGRRAGGPAAGDSVPVPDSLPRAEDSLPARPPAR